MVNWMRLLRSGQKVSYNDLPRTEVRALAEALDEWEWMMYRRNGSSPMWRKDTWGAV